MAGDRYGASAFADALAERLDAACRDPRQGLAGWRFNLWAGRQLQVGIADNEFAGVYTPAATRYALSGSIYLLWADGQVTHSNVQRETLDQFEDRLVEWRTAAYTDPHAAPLLPPSPVPDVPLYHPDVEAELDSGGERLFALLRRAQAELRAYPVEFLDASAAAMAGQRVLRSSSGIDYSEDQTSFGFWLSADNLYSNGYGERRPIEEAEVARLIADVGETVRRLKQPGQLESGVWEIILAPHLADQFLGTFFLRNFSGALLANRQSGLTIEDFYQQRRVVRADLSILMDPLQPYAASSERCTGEGVPARRFYILRDGRLQVPLVDVKYGRLLGYPPTPGGAALLLPATGGSFEALIASVEQGLLVYQVLGMHTQDAISGNFSLTAQQALAIRDGQLGGRVKSTIAGNFLEALRDPATAFGWDPHEPNPAIRLTATVNVE